MCKTPPASTTRQYVNTGRATHHAHSVAAGGADSLSLSAGAPNCVSCETCGPISEIYYSTSPKTCRCNWVSQG